MPPRHLIMLAYHFPPQNVAAARRPSRFYTYLPQFGYSPHVITAASQPDPGDPNIHHVPDLIGKLWEVPRQRRDKLPPAAHWERALRKFFFPGALGLAWSRQAAQAASAVVERCHPAPVAVMSSYPPLGGPLAALQVVRRWKLPWVADFHDPITVGQLRCHLSPLQFTACRFLERSFFRRAQAILVNTDEAAEVYRKTYPFAASKIHAKPNGFDRTEPLSALPIPERSYRLLVHAGALYDRRNPNVILESLVRLRAAQDPEACRTRLLLVGEVTEDAGLSESLSRTAIQEGWLEIIPRRIPQSEVRLILRQADGLLLLQPQTSLATPSKLFEYISIGRPILALAPRRSSVESILRQAGIPYCCVYPDEPPQSTDATISAFLRLPNSPVEPSPWFREHFDFAVTTGWLAQLLDRLIAPPQR